MDYRFSLVQSIDIFFTILYYLIIARIFMSWIPISRNNPIIRFIFVLTEPVLAPIRNMIHKSPLGGPGMMLDFSALIACILISVVKSLIIQLIMSI